MKTTPNQSPSAPPDELHPKAHPAARAVGAATGAVVGGLVGALGGPVGIIVGAAAGTIVGGNAGSVAAEDTDDRVAEGNLSDRPAADKDVVLSPPRDACDQGGLSSAGQQQVLSADKKEDNGPDAYDDIPPAKS